MRKPTHPSSQEQELIRAIQRIAGRLRMIRFSELLLRCLFYSLVAAVLAVVVIKVTPLRYSPLWLLAGFSLASLPLAVVLFLFSPVTMFEAAVIADQRLRLKERLSSALEVVSTGESQDDELTREWREVLVSEANQAGRGINPRRNFPFRSSREGRYLWLPLVVVLTVTFLLPEVDWSADKKAQASTELQENAARELKKLAERQLLFKRERKEQQSTKTERISKEIQDLARELSAGKIERREMMSRLAKLTDSIKQQRATLAQRQPEIRKLESTLQAKLTAPLAEALLEDDYATAAFKLSELKKLLDQGKMSDADMNRLSAELGKLSELLGGDSALAKSLGEALKTAALNLKAKDLAGALSALDLAGMNIEDLKDLLAQIAMLDEWMIGVGACRASIAGATGPFVLCPFCGGGNCGGRCVGAGIGFGGMGGPGRGRGGRAPFTETDTTLLPDRVSGQFQDAPILGSVLVDGLPARGEASVEFSDVVLQSRQAAEDALNRENVPLTYRSSVRRYFDALETENETESEDEG